MRLGQPAGPRLFARVPERLGIGDLPHDHRRRRAVIAKSRAPIKRNTTPASLVEGPPPPVSGVVTARTPEVGVGALGAVGVGTGVMPCTAPVGVAVGVALDVGVGVMPSTLPVGVAVGVALAVGVGVFP